MLVPCCSFCLDSLMMLTKPSRCSTCGGQGRVVSSTRTPLGIFQQSMTCSSCNVTGEISTPCSTCSGDGRVRETKRINLKVPAGVELWEADEEETMLRVQNVKDLHHYVGGEAVLERSRAERGRNSRSLGSHVRWKSLNANFCSNSWHEFISVACINSTSHACDGHVGCCVAICRHYKKKMSGSSTSGISYLKNHPISGQRSSIQNLRSCQI